MRFYKTNALYFRYNKKYINSVQKEFFFQYLSRIMCDKHINLKSFLKLCMAAYNCYSNTLLAGSGKSKFIDILYYTRRPCYNKQASKQTNKTNQSVSQTHVCLCVCLCICMLVCRTEGNIEYCSFRGFYLVL